MRNERTSKRIAKSAGKIMALKIPGEATVAVFYVSKKLGPVYMDTGLMWRDVIGPAASALTQTADKPEKQRVPKDFAERIRSKARKTLARRKAKRK